MAYLGTQPNDVKKNTGLYTPSEILQLEKDGHWGGSLELLESKDLTGTNPTALDFTNMQENNYNVHLLTYNNLQITSGSDTIRLRVSDDGGSTYESASVYDSAVRILRYNATFATPSFRVNYNAFDRIGQNAVDQPYSGYIYIYNAGDSSKTTSISFHNSTMEDGFRYGGGTYKVTSTINALRLYLSTYEFKDVGSVVNLYGIKQ